MDDSKVYPDQVPPDLSRMTEVGKPVERAVGPSRPSTRGEVAAVVDRLSKEFQLGPDTEAVDAAARKVARVARSLLRTGLHEERKSRDRATVTIVVDSDLLFDLRNALTAWDDEAHALVTGGGR